MGRFKLPVIEASSGVREWNRASAATKREYLHQVTLNLLQAGVQLPAIELVENRMDELWGRAEHQKLTVAQVFAKLVADFAS